MSEPFGSDMRYEAFHNLIWLWLVPALAALLAYGIWQRRRAMASFVGTRVPSALERSVGVVRVWIRAACVIAAAGLIVIALAEPQWGKYRAAGRSAGRDIIVALDVSRSMLAEDVVPSRLERAKADIRDLAAAVEQSGGHRLGLIAFAGTASIKCPLTQVYSHFVRVLEDLEPRSVATGGTLIGDCIREATAGFDDKTQNFRDLILISDGEDMDSFPAQAAEAARDAGITIYVIGLGDPDRGAEIPITDRSGQRSFLEHDGQVVLSKLGDDTLRQIAAITGGIYVPAGLRSVELDRIFRDYIEPKTKRDMEASQRERWRHRFQWFLAPAIVLLGIESLWIASARRRGPDKTRSSSGAATRPAASTRKSFVPAAVLLCTVLARPAIADDARELVIDGNRLYESGQFAEAAERYQRAAALQPESAIPLYNHAAALFQSGDYAGAIRLYEQARARAPENLRQRIPFAIGNSYLQQALRAQEQPQAAIDSARSAIRFYRDAISNDPANTESAALSDAARYNLELAKRLIQQLQQQTQPQNQPSDPQQQQQNQDKPTGSNQDRSKGGERDQPPRPEPGDTGEQQQNQPRDGDDPAPERSSAREQLSPEEAEQQLRAAIARAQAARARRVTETTKRAKAKVVAKDW